MRCREKYRERTPAHGRRLKGGLLLHSTALVSPGTLVGSGDILVVSTGGEGAVGTWWEEVREGGRASYSEQTALSKQLLAPGVSRAEMEDLSLR